MRLLEALRGMVGLVQLVQERYPDFPVDNHRVIEAMSAIKEAESALPEALRSGWKPIEDAPKDRNIILTNGKVVSEGGWLSDMDVGAEYEGQCGMAGWWSVEGMDGKPTHWQPMPSVPSPLGKQS